MDDNNIINPIYDLPNSPVVKPLFDLLGDEVILTFSIIITLIINFFLVSKNANLTTIIIANILISIVNNLFGLAGYDLISIIINFLIEQITAFIEFAFNWIVDIFEQFIELIKAPFKAIGEWFEGIWPF